MAENAGLLRLHSYCAAYPISHVTLFEPELPGARIATKGQVVAMNLTDEGSLKDDLSTTARGSTSTTSNMTLLPENYEPGSDDVICGRGKKCYNHIGK